MAVDKDVRAALDTIFAVDSDFYKNRGWNQRSGYGERPALLNIDLANAWTRPGHRFSCNDMDEQIIPGVQRLNAAARAKGRLEQQRQREQDNWEVKSQVCLIQ